MAYFVPLPTAYFIINICTAGISVEWKAVQSSNDHHYLCEMMVLFFCYGVDIITLDTIFLPTKITRLLKWARSWFAIYSCGDVEEGGLGVRGQTAAICPSHTLLHGASSVTCPPPPVPEASPIGASHALWSAWSTLEENHGGGRHAGKASATAVDNSW